MYTMNSTNNDKDRDATYISLAVTKVQRYHKNSLTYLGKKTKHQVRKHGGIVYKAISRKTMFVITKCLLNRSPRQVFHHQR